MSAQKDQDARLIKLLDLLKDDETWDLISATNDLELMDAFSHLVGLLAMRDPRPPSPEEQAELDVLYARTLEMMSKLPPGTN